MKFAVISKNGKTVENLIVMKPEQKEEIEKALNRTLMEAAPLGMEIGDFFNGKNWTRNIDGEQVPLPIGDNAAVDEMIALLEEVDAL